MLRTNTPFLSFIESLPQKQQREDDILVKQFDAGDPILKQGETVHRIFVIKEGITKCYISEENGKDFIFEFLGKGEIIGEIEFLRNINCLCTIDAVSSVSVYSLSTSYFKKLLHENPELNTLLLNELADRIINTCRRSSYQQLYTLEYGLLKLFELQLAEQMTITKEDMAAYLGITIRSLNRVIKELKAKLSDENNFGKLKSIVHYTVLLKIKALI